MLNFSSRPRIRELLAASSTVSGCTLTGNQATGAGGPGANGGDGFGGVIYNNGQSTLTVLGTTIAGNQADGGAAGAGSTAGLGNGGGVYLATGCVAEFNALPTISGNTASTGNDDVFGVFTTL